MSSSVDAGDPAAPVGPSTSATVVVALLVALVAILPAFSHDLWNPDEPRVAHLAQSMLDGGDRVVPRVNGRAFVEQPPLHVWIVAGCMAIFGSGPGRDWVPRLPSMAFGLALLVLVYHTGRNHGGHRTGLLAVVVLATTAEFFVAYQRAIVDTSLTFFVALAMTRLLSIVVAGAGAVPSWRSVVVLGTATGLSFLAKNLIGVAFIALVAIALAIRYRSIFLRLEMIARLAVAGFVAIVVAAPWVVTLGVHDPALVEELLVGNTLGRFVRGDIHNVSVFEFSHRMLAVLLPWIVLIPVAHVATVRALVCGRSGDVEGPARRRFTEGLLWWTLLPMALVLASSSRREMYLLPVTPAIALALALWLEPHLSRPAVRAVSMTLGLLLGTGAPILVFVGGVWVESLRPAVWVFLFLHLAVVYRFLRRRERREGEGPAWTLAVLVLSSLGIGSIVAFQANNSEESYVPLCRVLATERERGFDLLLFMPLHDENAVSREQSAISYYLRQPVENLQTLDAVETRFQDASRPAVLVFRERDAQRLLGRLERFHDIGTFRARRRLGVIANRSPVPVK